MAPPSVVMRRQYLATVASRKSTCQRHTDVYVSGNPNVSKRIHRGSRPLEYFTKRHELLPVFQLLQSFPDFHLLRAPLSNHSTPIFSIRAGPAGACQEYYKMDNPYRFYYVHVFILSALAICCIWKTIDKSQIKEIKYLKFVTCVLRSF